MASIRRQKKWVMAGFAAIAIGMAAIIGLQAYKAAGTSGTGGGTGQDARQIASLKELAAAIKNPETREEAIRTLPEQEGAKAVDLLSALGHKSRDAEVRAAALTALSDIGDIRGLQVLTIGCRDNDASVRIAAVEGLGKLATDTAFSAIAEALANDIDVSVRKAAAVILGASKGSSVTLDTLAKRLTAEDDVDVRGLVATAMGKLKDVGARRVLISALQNEMQGKVRLRVLQALDAVDDDYRVKGVACAIGDTDKDVRAGVGVDRGRKA